MRSCFAVPLLNLSGWQVDSTAVLHEGLIIVVVYGRRLGARASGMNLSTQAMPLGPGRQDSPTSSADAYRQPAAQSCSQNMVLGSLCMESLSMLLLILGSIRETP